jgi:hypothetical protein
MNPRTTLAAAFLSAVALAARADAVTDWNIKSGELLTEAKMGTPPAVRVMAIVQTAAYEAAKSAGKSASMDAAIAAAHHATLSKLMPAQQGLIDTAYHAAIAKVEDGPAKTLGLDEGRRAAAMVLAARAAVIIPAESYRPHAAAGTYVPTAAAAAPQWGGRAPWLMSSPAQFRPAPPPALDSTTWARDFNEVKALGAKASTTRTPEQTDIARFWEYSLPSIYHGVVRSVAAMPGRDTLRNARLFAAVAQAMDDALIGVFDAKYHYNFWRPITAIRNGDIDGNNGTEREAAWSPLVDAPLHPEYPSGHSILASAVAAVIEADLGKSSTPVLSTASPSAKGAARSWLTVADFAREVSESRIYAGIHYRSALDAGATMGKQIGDLAAARVLESTQAVASR